jgi:hypothetical protein
MYFLYPVYNKDNNTVYLYTVEEYVASDKSFVLQSVANASYTKYKNSSINLSYTYDPKDPLLTDKEFDYGTGNDIVIKLLFSPTKTRRFTLSDYAVGDNYGTGGYDLPSIASQDQINLDRLSLSLSDTVDYLPWNSSTTYDRGDQVEYNGYFFTSIITGNTNNIPQLNGLSNWVQDFIGDFNTDKDFDYVPRLLEYKYDTNKISGVTAMTTTAPFLQVYPKRLTPPSDFYFAFQTAEFSDDLNLNFIFNKYYDRYLSLVNNRTSLLTGQAYIPYIKFIKFFNRPVEITYLSDTYILLGINNYNPISEIGTVSLIKKVNYKNWQ